MRRLGVHIVAAAAMLSMIACASRSKDQTKPSPAVTGVVISTQPAPNVAPLATDAPPAAPAATDTSESTDDRTAAQPKAKKRRAKKGDVAAPEILGAAATAAPKPAAPAPEAVPTAPAPAAAAPPPASSDSLAQRAADVDQHPYDKRPKAVEKIDQHPYD